MFRVGLTGGVGSGKSAVARVWADAGVPVLEADAMGRALMLPGQSVFNAIVAAFGPDVVASDGQLDRAALARMAFAIPSPALDLSNRSADRFPGQSANGVNLAPPSRLAELNAIVHPQVLAAQEQELTRLAATGDHPLAVVESALIFEASGEASVETSGEASSEAPGEEQSHAAFRSHSASKSHSASAPGWSQRFDKLVLVTAPEPVRIDRFILRVGGPHATDVEKARLRADAERRIAAQLPEAWKRDRCDYVIENDRSLVLLRREALRVLAVLRHAAAMAADRPRAL